MIIDSTFWVAISFFIFVFLIFYFKIPEKIKITLEENIGNIKKQIDDAEKLKEEAKTILSDYEKKISGSKSEIKKMIEKANEETEKNVLKTNSEFHILMDNRKKSAEEKEKLYKKLDFGLDFINLFFLVVTTIIFSSLLFFYRKMAPIQEQLQDVLENTRTVKNIAEKLEGIVDMTNNATADQLSSAQSVLDSYLPAL